MGSKGPLIITGMHRSGTSLVARFIHRSGIDLGDRLIGPRESNRYGHFEDIDVVRFHERVLVREFGHPMWAPQKPELDADDRRRAERLIAERKEKPHWGWKDPRTCLFLEFWHRLLTDARYLFVARHPLMVLDSLSRRTNSRFYHLRKHSEFLRAWLLHNRECLRFHQQHQSTSLLVMLEDVLDATDAFVDLLSDLVMFKFDIETFRHSYQPVELARQRSRWLWARPRLRKESLSLYNDIKDTSCLR